MYARGLTLGGEKTRDRGASTLIGRLGTEGERTRREMAEFAGDYDWNEREVSEAERQIAVDAFDGAVTALYHDRYERSEFVSRSGSWVVFGTRTRWRNCQLY